MAVQENSIGLESLETKIGIILAGEMGVGGPISFTFSRCAEVGLKLAFSQSANCTLSPLRSTEPLPLVISISSRLDLGSLLTRAALSGASEAVAPSIITSDLEPCT